MDKDLQDAFRRIKKRDVDTFIASIVSVDKVNGTCVISDGKLQYIDVQLASIVNDSNQKFYLFPKDKSWVIVSPINEDLNRLYVEVYSEIESLSLVIDKVQFQVDKDGFLFKKENENLKKLMADLIKAIKDLKFTTNNGPTIQLINLADFTALEDRFNQFLKDK